ncbi:hypothetical protein [Polaribacter cellanae]|uniref:Thioredoxin-like fold domain-containing protein n=1 Tax=Polaribacter cellanae TaxID=2818493 RepID=A0A975CQM1_9FLAO|nr:hypothetical protein [Polaribacter cellanae]QTE23545.1 hypothetical protein J3359_04480 [Polaribacter cellanae]
MIILTFLIIQCKQSREENNSISKNLSIKKNILEQQKKSIRGKKIKSLSDILEDSLKTSNKTIFLYNGFDCGTCIDVGYEISKKIDSLNKSKKVYIISTSANIGRDQLKNSYIDYVYNDEKDLIRKELKFIYTPVFLRLDIEGSIKNVFFPNYNRDFKAEENFILKCVSK